jgi:hypothetical protein
MKLTAENVNQVFQDCLFGEGDDTTNHVPAPGVMITVGFNPDKLFANTENVRTLLSQLPDEFGRTTGGGWSFLQACMTKAGEHWGEHANIDQLLCLGLATGQVEYLMPRDMWAMFPGGMPYFLINATA